MSKLFIAMGIAFASMLGIAGCGSTGETVGTAGGASIVNLPSPNPVFQDIADDGFILPQDIPADASTAISLSRYRRPYASNTPRNKASGSSNGSASSARSPI